MCSLPRGAQTFARKMCINLCPRHQHSPVLCSGSSKESNETKSEDRRATDTPHKRFLSTTHASLANRYWRIESYESPLTFLPGPHPPFVGSCGCCTRSGDRGGHGGGQTNAPVGAGTSCLETQRKQNEKMVWVPFTVRVYAWGLPWQSVTRAEWRQRDAVSDWADEVEGVTSIVSVPTDAQQFRFYKTGVFDKNWFFTRISLHWVYYFFNSSRWPLYQDAAYRHPKWTNALKHFSGSALVPEHWHLFPQYFTQWPKKD